MSDHNVAYRKSSYSGGGNECVEVASDLHSVRDSKNPTGPVLHVNDISTLLGMIKNGS